MNIPEAHAKIGPQSYSDIQGFLNKIDLDQLPKLQISVLRNIMLEPIEPYLRYAGYKIGFDTRIRFGEYDNIFQEAIGGHAKLLNAEIDCVLIFARLEGLSWDLARKLPAMNPEQVNTELDRIQHFVAAVLEGIRKYCRAVILWHGFEIPIYPAYGIRDNHLAGGQLAILSNLNQRVVGQLAQHQNAYFVDLNLCLARLGAQSFYDLRYWHIGKAPYTRAAMAEIVSEDFKYLRAVKGKNKKCLVLDCDNTLWGGVVGEEGIAGIALGKSYPGSAYYELQQEILNLYHKGIILALCSKNNEADVWQVFREHPGMILKREHIAAARINWQDKATNIKQLAQDLNIGLDSMVFVDDSEFEIELISRTLPEVEVIHLPGKAAFLYQGLLASCGWFDGLMLTSEDQQRGSMYQAEAERNKVRSEVQLDVEAFCKSLNMVVTVRFADDFAIPRIAQLTQKTNQFNLTTHRYTEIDIKSLVDGDDSDVVYLGLKDRFGDLGIVGVCILKYESSKAIFDTFLLSCRALGRRIEDVMLQHGVKLAELRGSRTVIGTYAATRKNEQVKDFYANQGFKLTTSNDGIDTFVLDLTRYRHRHVAIFKTIDSEISQAV